MNWIQKLKTNKKTLIWGGIGLVVLIIIITSVSGGKGDLETVLVERRDVSDDVRVSGTVQASIISDMGFEVSGVVHDVSVKEGQTVYRGQRLAGLSLGTLAAELQSAQADLVIKRAEVANTGINVDTIRSKYDTIVENAYNKLLSEGIVAEPESTIYTQTPPVITGRYSGEAGTYKIGIKRGRQAGKTDMYVFKLETTGAVEINDTGPTKLGTKGLYISFPDGETAYRDTTWYVTVPNTKSSVYQTNYSAYQEALESRDEAIEDAEAQVRSQSEGMSIAEAELAQAEAGVARIQAQISQRILTAPFDAVVTSVTIDPGEAATAGQPALSLISNDGFGVEVDLPEIDSVKVGLNNTAEIFIDSLGDEKPLSGRVVSVNRTETLVDGVPVYEARLAFDVEDSRIASGMTADVTITTDRRVGVLAIPFRALQTRDDGSSFVLVQTEDEKEGKEVAVTTGLRGSDGMIEIRAGLEEGQTVLIPAK